MQQTSATAPNRPTDAVRTAAHHRPTAPALIADDTLLTWADLDARVDAQAGRLAALVPRGFVDDGPPPRVAVALPNGIDFAVTYFAVLRAGLIAVPLNPGYTADELQHALADSGAAVLVADDDVAARVAGGPPGLTIASPRDTDAAPTTAPTGVSSDDAVAVLLYTSGTAGRPKGAMLSRAALTANHRQLSRIQPPLVGADDVVLLAMPLFHAYGLNTGLGAVAHHGACGVLVDRFDAAASLALIARHRVTVTVGVPTMYAAWSRLPAAASAMASVRTAVCGAAPLDPADAARFADVTGRSIVVGYGLTETAPVLTTTAVTGVAKPGSIGRPLPGVELLLRSAQGRAIWHDGAVDADADSDDLHLAVESSPGTDPGEIVVRGANLFSGYWPDGRGGPDADGWWATGDVAYADGDGDLVLVDRIGELVIVNGFNVYPAEVERVLLEHPDVAEAAVVAAPSPQTGQTPHAYVVAAGEPAPTVDDLLAYCARRLARFKLPTSIRVVPRLPRSAIGKVRKSHLRSEHP